MNNKFSLVFIFLFLFGIISLYGNYINAERVKRSVDVKSIPKFTSNFNYYIDKAIKLTKDIDTAFKHIWHYTCFEFTKHEDYPDKNGMVFRYSKNESYFTYAFNKRLAYVYLNDECLKNTGCVKHYIAFAFGLQPEINRYDRGKYVEMLWDNLEDDGKSFYKREDGTKTRILNTAFDFGSIMMPSQSYKAKKGKKAFNILAEPEYENMVGQRGEFSHNDLKKLNDMYCGNRCVKKLKGCKNGGYPNPDCGKCLCPNGYTGKFCTQTQKGFGKCANLWLKATKKVKKLSIKGIAKCYISITSKPGTKVAIHVVNGLTLDKKPCNDNTGLEIKYRHDRGSTGLCLCGSFKNVTIIPTFSQALLIYYGDRDNNYVNLEYHEYK
ncbi:Astacin-like metalloendopeptidase [Strongyloides ratti]|uniref:Metalloendopeptidase n=1 Tax=Strongyloides ratti TaxID=34506 RepID=A0A090LQN4_STRRB|nr:Astacin-like metalloendopeptidase [Strongyloides ratti]CEF69886.1 Astacin-like metalloendopeptidase [Strongyloides ratti]